MFDSDRLDETTLSVKGDSIDAWYSVKHRDFGANIQAIMRPGGVPIWTFDAMPGHFHDLSCARELGVTAALNWAASELNLPALADAGYDGAGHGIKTLVKQPADGKRLAIANRSVSRLLRVCAGKASEAPPFWSDAGKHCATARSVPAGSGTSSPPHSTSLILNTATYPKVAEIISLNVTVQTQRGLGR